MPDSNGDRIYIRRLHARCIIGIFPEERTEKQDVYLDITMHADLRAAGVSDAIEDTVDYKRVKKRVLAMVEGSEYFLIERLAEKTAAICFEDERVHRVEVVIDKPGALRFADSVAVHIVRYRPTPDQGQDSPKA